MLDDSFCCLRSLVNEYPEGLKALKSSGLMVEAIAIHKVGVVPVLSVYCCTAYHYQCCCLILSRELSGRKHKTYFAGMTVCTALHLLHGDYHPPAIAASLACATYIKYVTSSFLSQLDN